MTYWPCICIINMQSGLRGDKQTVMMKFLILKWWLMVQWLSLDYILQSITKIYMKFKIVAIFFFFLEGSTVRDRKLWLKYCKSWNYVLWSKWFIKRSCLSYLRIIPIVIIVKINTKLIPIKLLFYNIKNYFSKSGKFVLKNKFIYQNLPKLTTTKLDRYILLSIQNFNPPFFLWWDASTSKTTFFLLFISKQSCTEIKWMENDKYCVDLFIFMVREKKRYFIG